MNLEILFRTLEKTTKAGCWNFDIATEQLYWSKKVHDLHEVPPSYKPNINDAINFYHPEDQDKIKNAFMKCLEDGKEFKLRLRIITYNNKTIFIETYGNAIKVDGVIKSVFGTFKDISNEVNIIHQKNIYERKFSNFFNSINEFFIIAETDINGCITFVNDKFCEISGYAREELIGQNHRLLSSDQHDKKFFEDLWKTISSGRPWEGLICNKSKTGEKYWVQTFIFPNYIGNKISGYVAIRFDVTDKRILVNELADEKKKSEFSAQLAAVGEISAGIAHEINNPLTIIMGKASIMKAKCELNDTAKGMVVDMENAANRIRKITKGLHHLAQRSRNDQHAIYELNTIIQYTFDFCEEALKGKQIKLEYEPADGENKIYLLCDEIQISQIILNLINNARDSILESGVKEKWIKIYTKKTEDIIEVYVYDSGPGVPDDIKEKVLSAFFTTKEVGKGTGLGLALVSRFLKEHNGHLDIISDEIGTGFKFSLPLIK